MAEDERSWKKDFREKITDREKFDDSDLTKKYKVLKKKHRLAMAKLDKERQDVRNMEENPSYIAAKKQVSDQELVLSKIQWKMGEIESESVVRLRLQEEMDEE